jgi:low affinity Fe/Cu permease
VISRFLGSYIGIASVIAFCGAWLALALGENRLTLALSILALTFSQLILLQARRDRDRDEARDKALHAKIDALIHGVPDAPDELAGSEPE